MPGYKPQVVVQTTSNQAQQNVNTQTPQPNVNVAPQQPVQPTQVAPQPAAQVVQPQNLQTAPQPAVAQPVAPNMAQPAQPQVGVQPAQTQAVAGGIIPGQDGVPANITEKGIADLQRLERLKSMGAITPENYAVMKQKICTENVG